MWRLLIFVLALVAIGFAATSSAQAYDHAFEPDNLGALDPGSAVNQRLFQDTQLEEKQNKLGDLGDLIVTIKNQIKEAIREVISQIVENLKSLFHGLKVKLFKKLGKMTMLDIFRSIFGGVSEFVQDSSSSGFLESQSFSKPVVKPAYDRPSSVFGNQEYWQK